MNPDWTRKWWMSFNGECKEPRSCNIQCKVAYRNDYYAQIRKKGG